MFFYSSESRFTHSLVFKLLDSTTVEQYIDEMASWSEQSWGYMQNYPGVDFQKAEIKNLANQFYVVLYASVPIGMFALVNDDTRPGKSKSLMYFYVDKTFRGMGVGRRMFEEVKTIAKTGALDTLTFNTLNPRLNATYEKFGASYLCELPVPGVTASLFRL